MKKRPYDLDYTIENEADRVAYVNTLVAHLDAPLSASDLEQLGDYIMYGRDDNGQNAVQRGETLDSSRRHKETYIKASEKVESWNALLDSEAGDFNEQRLLPRESWGLYTHPREEVRRPYRRANGTTDPGDSHIPGMRDLWKRIDKLEYTLKANEGKVPLKPDTPIVESSYQLYRLRHVLIDMYKEQYALKEAHNPTLRWRVQPHNYTPPSNFDEDTAYWMPEKEWRKKLRKIYNPRISRNIDDYETKVTPNGVYVKWVVNRASFDWENPRHVRALMEHYDLLKAQNGDNPDTWGYNLLREFEFYRQKAQFSPLREYLISRRLERANYIDLVRELEEKFGIKYNTSYMCRVLTYELPTTIARAATKYRLLTTTPKEKCKPCERCGTVLPAHSIFFGICNTAEDKLTNVCRECDRKRRKANSQGENNTYDQRKKDQTMHTMQAGTATRKLPTK